MFSKTRRLVALAVFVVIAAFAVGCGGGDDDGGGDTSGSTSSAPSTQASAESAGDGNTPQAGAAQEGVGGQVPSDKTIGFLNIQGTAPAAQRLQAAFEAGAAKWGWKVNVVDAQGDPAKMASGVQTFVNQKVDAIVTISVQPAAAQQALQAAKDAGIPAIDIGGPVSDPDGLYAAQFVPNDYGLAAELFSFIINDLNGEGDLVAIDQNQQAVPALIARAKLVEPLFGDTKIKVVANAEADFKNPVQSAVQAAQDLLSANPNAKGIITYQDYQFGPVSQALKNSTKFKDVKVYGFYAGEDTLQALRDPDSPARAVADSPVSDSAWVAVDALVRYFTNDTEPTSVSQWLRPYPLTLISDENVNINVPSDAKEYPFPSAEEYYAKLWESQGFESQG